MTALPDDGWGPTGMVGLLEALYYFDSDTVRVVNAQPKITITRHLIESSAWLRVVGDLLYVEDDYGARYIYRIQPSGDIPDCLDAEWVD